MDTNANISCTLYVIGEQTTEMTPAMMFKQKNDEYLECSPGGAFDVKARRLQVDRRSYLIGQDASCCDKEHCYHMKTA